jgi:chloride channel protein, CIC family
MDQDGQLTPELPGSPALARAAAGASAWLRAGRGGMFLLALVVGAGSGLGAVAFRYLVYFFTWLATGQDEFGQAGYVGSSHLPWLGLGFFVLIPAIGGLLYGPLIYRYAREARGHGVPEVMIAVADNGGRIRWQVSVVKALASALCIGSGGSVGREGPIAQIGSALASGIGQWVRMPENRLRIMVACGAAGGVSATFNAPITGVFFGLEIILREFAADAVFTVMLSSMVADLIAIPFLGDKPFLSGFPAGLVLHNYLLVVVLAVIAALMGLTFKNVLYRVEDRCDAIWKGRPEWARPAVLGLGFGLLLLALPQMYGVGYPVMFKATAGGYALWFLIVLAFGKILATSLTMGVGGSGGIFAPSLFIGVTTGYAYGDIVDHLFGAGAGQPALYAVIAMGAVFAAAARAPLTSLASVVEMTGDFSLTLPVMLAVAIATAVSRALSYGTIYTAKLLRRGSDIDRASPWRALQDLKLADVMRPFQPTLPIPPALRALPADTGTPTANGSGNTARPAAADDPAACRYDPQALSASESLAQALPQLDVHGRDGLPVISADGRRVEGWITSATVLRALARQLAGTSDAGVGAQASADGGRCDDTEAIRPYPSAPLAGYQVTDLTITADSPAAGRNLHEVTWPQGGIPVSVLRGRRLGPPDPGITLAEGDRVGLLIPAPSGPECPRADGVPGGSDLPQPRHADLVAHRSVGRQACAQPVQFVGADQLRKLGLDRVGRRSDRDCRRASALGQADLHPPPVHRVIAALEILAENEGVDQLAGRLLAQPQRGDDIGLGAEHRIRRGVVQVGEDEWAVTGNVVAPRACERPGDGVAVDVARLAHQLRHGDVLVPGAIGHLLGQAATEHRAPQ